MSIKLLPRLYEAAAKSDAIACIHSHSIRTKLGENRGLTEEIALSFVIAWAEYFDYLNKLSAIRLINVSRVWLQIGRIVPRRLLIKFAT